MASSSVKIFDRVEIGGLKGPKLEKAMAVMRPTQDALDASAARAYAGARAQLAKHTHSGDSTILIERGSVDRFVILSDVRGQQAAWAIENGAAGGRGGVHALAVGALAKLGKAAGGIW